MRTVIAAAVTALIAGGAGATAAQDARDSVATTVPEVVVEALRGSDAVRDVPAATFVLPRSELVRASSGRIASALAVLPGLFGYGASGSGEPRTVDPRGFTANGESSYLKLLVNGHDVRGVENGEVDWDWVPASSIERVEVVQGSGAWLYGDGSEGGVVNVVTRTPIEGVATHGAARGGSFGLRAGNVVTSLRRDAFEAAARGGFRRADGFRDHAEEEVVTVGAGLASGEVVRWGADAAWLDARHQEPGALTRDQIRADRRQADTPIDFRHARRLVAGAHVALHHRDRGEWRIAPYVRHEDVDQVRTIFFEPKAHPTRATTTGAELTWRHPGAEGARTLAFHAGVQAERSRLTSEYRDPESGALEARGAGDRTTLAGFASARIALGERVTARLGLRGDLIRVGPLETLGGGEIDDRTLSSVSPFAGLTRTVGAGGSVWGSVSTSFRAPTMNQLFDQRPFFVPGVGTIFLSNPDLDPQRALNFEIGARHDGPGRQLLATVYSSHVRDEIDFDLATFSYANLGESWHRGVELAATQALGGGLWVTANGAWMPTTIEGSEDSGNQINAVPVGTAYGAVRWARDDRWSAEAGLRWAGPQWLDKANDHELPDFASLEVGAAVRIARARVLFRVANLLDREYEESGFLGALGEERFLPAPGRSGSLAVTFD